MKKLNKLVAILVAMAMVLAMGVVSAFAEDLTPAQKNNDPKLVKYLKMDNGITIPEKTFTFSFANTQKPTGSTLTTPQTMTITTDEMHASTANDDAGALVGAKGIASVFEGLLDKAGVYVFTVTEEGTNDDNWTYDKTSEYTLTLYVDNEGDIQNATVKQKNAEDKENTTIEDPSELDPEPGKDGVGFTFTNEYEVAEEDQRDETTAALKVKKEISGDYADSTAAYPFALTLTNSDNRYDATIPAYISVNGTKKAGSDTTFELNGNNNTFTLIPGEELVIVNLQAGTTFAVKENLNNAPVQRVEAYSADAAKQAETAINITKAYDGTENRDLTFTGAAAIQDNKVANGYTVTNTATDPEPEGILISNLPYIALALVAIGGLVAYVVVRRRNTDEA